MTALFFLIVFVLVLYLLVRLACRNLLNNRKAGKWEISFFVFYWLMLIIFLFGTSGADYYTAIDPGADDYTAFSTAHFLSLVVFFLLSLASMLGMRSAGCNQPPLLLLFEYIFLIIGIFVCSAAMWQVSLRTETGMSFFGESPIINLLFPLIHIIYTIYAIETSVNDQALQAAQRTYKNKFLNDLNRILSKKSTIQNLALILIIPVFWIIVMILTLFGQEADSMIKVFTETTTWHLSQQTHPPLLEHHGHYLCTVAAKGHKSIVKPMGIGHRHDHEIIVNRQLQIANAFEHLIKQSHPAIHHYIRKNYDHYGFPLAKQINNKYWSDAVYLIMKPLEWIFLFTLYLFHHQPETLIAQQYKYNSTQ